jgi:hypothetical protein
MAGGSLPRAESLYYHTALDAMELAKSETDDFKKMQKIASSLVFSALCLEAYINQQYAANGETAKILEENDFLKLEQKWLMLPLLLGNNETFDRSRCPFQDFRELVRIRNQRLVHFKPSRERRLDGEEYNEADFLKLVGDVSIAEKFVKCIGEMIRELNRLTGGKTEISNFLHGSKAISSTWKTTSVRWRGESN